MIDIDHMSKLIAKQIDNKKQSTQQKAEAILKLFSSTIDKTIARCRKLERELGKDEEGLKKFEQKLEKLVEQYKHLVALVEESNKEQDQGEEWKRGTSYE